MQIEKRNPDLPANFAATSNGRFERAHRFDVALILFPDACAPAGCGSKGEEPKAVRTATMAPP